MNIQNKECLTVPVLTILLSYSVQFLVFVFLTWVSGVVKTLTSLPQAPPIRDTQHAELDCLAHKARQMYPNHRCDGEKKP